MNYIISSIWWCICEICICMPFKTMNEDADALWGGVVTRSNIHMVHHQSACLESEENVRGCSHSLFLSMHLPLRFACSRISSFACLCRVRTSACLDSWASDAGVRLPGSEACRCRRPPAGGGGMQMQTSLGGVHAQTSACWDFLGSGADVRWFMLWYVFDPRRSEVLTFWVSDA